MANLKEARTHQIWTTFCKSNYKKPIFPYQVLSTMGPSITRYVLASFFLLLVVIEGIHAVDASKFKKCSDVSFCKRHRQLSPRSLDYKIKSDSIKVEGNSFKAVIEELNSQTNYKLSLELYKPSILRLRINEVNPILPRYEVNDVVLENNLKPKAWGRYDQKEQTLYTDNGKVVIDLDQMKIDVYYGKELAVSTNSRGLFYFEYLRKKDVVQDIPLDENEEVYSNKNKSFIDMKDSWEERWSGFHDPKIRGPESVGMDFTFNSKNIYGIPEHTVDFDLPPTKGAGVNRDPYRLYNLDVFQYILDSEMALYGAVPLIYGHDENKTAAVWWLNAAETYIDVEKSEERIDTHWFSESGIVDAFIILGKDPRSVISQYGLLTGGQQLPPLFSIAYHQCRWNYHSESEVEELQENFEKHNIPVDVIWLDIEHTDKKKYFTWNAETFPTPERMLESLDKYGRKLVTIIDPHIKRDQTYHIHQEATSLGLYVKNPKDEDYEGWCWPGASSYLDFSNPKTRNWWATKFSYENYKGSASNLFTWNDMNEPSVFNGPEITMHKDSLHHGNIEHRHIHNLYGFYMQMSTYKGQLERNSEKDKRPFVLSRSFFSGSQRYGAIWTGDNEASWEHLRASVPMLLSLGMGGITFSGADVGGFFGDVGGELLTRWYQLGAWYPFFRAHGHIDTKRREPWVYPEPYLGTMREAIRTRYIHLPYIYTQFYHAHKELLPIMRPVLFEFPKDRKTYHLEDQFLVGPSIMVKPVGYEGLRQTTVYFPENSTWYDWKSSKKFVAGSHVVNTPLDYSPVFYRGGSIIPIKETIRRSSILMKNDPYSLIVALGEDGNASGDLYIDDGESVHHQNGELLYTKLEYSRAEDADTLKLKVVEGSLQFENTINRITILGNTRTPKTIEAVQEDKSLSIDFEINKERGEIVLRKPDMLVSKDWSITLKY